MSQVRVLLAAFCYFPLIS